MGKKTPNSSSRPHQTTSSSLACSYWEQTSSRLLCRPSSRNRPAPGVTLEAPLKGGKAAISLDPRRPAWSRGHTRTHARAHTLCPLGNSLNCSATSRVSQPSPGLSVTAALLSSHKTSPPCNSKRDPKNGQRRSSARTEVATSRPLKGPDGCPVADKWASRPSSPRSLGIIKQELHRPAGLSYQPEPLIREHTSSSEETKRAR